MIALASIDFKAARDLQLPWDFSKTSSVKNIMVSPRERKQKGQKKRVCTAHKFNHDFRTAIFLQRYFLIKLNGLGEILILNFCTFWIIWERGFIIFDARNLFLCHSHKFGTCGNRISTKIWFASIPSSHPGESKPNRLSK